MRQKKKSGFKLAGKKHSKRGKISLFLALCSVFAGVGMVVLSIQSNGNASVYVGSAGLFALFVSLTSLIIGLSSLKEESYKLFPVLGSICSVLTLAGWVAVYMLGF
ncbi:hypothetical protein E5329_02015 [Petralouisia muris]|jgi:hypothetical protein|uniref:Uncharacterized protein n=1 Tax=Petralouisia muris TaxID=3032872 RepID=A0AC61S1B1_9FIRM|nr:DUF6142 family protein [Petralouisia muris]TGY97923.1 hypothetical protein E5329_02015 [Petralouisia muris]